MLKRVHIASATKKWLLAALIVVGSASPVLAACVNMFGVPGTCAAGGGILATISCNFMSTMYTILSIAYCSILVAVKPALAAALLLYIIIFGLLVSVGAMQLSAKEVVVRLLKIALIWLFATQASYTIGFAYNGLIGIANDATYWVLNAALGISASGGNFNSVFALIDTAIYQKLLYPLTSQGAALFGFFLTLSYALPPIFLLFMYLMIKTIAIFVRAIISYLLGISAITFLIALAPIFVSFALFKVTTQFFESWMRYMISFALQIVMVFAAVAMWLLMVDYIGSFLAEVGNFLVYVKKELFIPPNSTEINIVSICKYQVVNTVAGMKINCLSLDPNEALPPSTYAMAPDIMYYLVVRIVTLVMIAYAFDTLLKQIPDLARQLSGPKYVPMIAGGSRGDSGSMLYPGGQAFSAIGSSTAAAFNRESGDLFSKMGSGLREAAHEAGNQLGFRNPNAKALGAEQTPAAEFREKSSTLLGRGNVGAPLPSPHPPPRAGAAHGAAGAGKAQEAVREAALIETQRELREVKGGAMQLVRATQANLAHNGDGMPHAERVRVEGDMRALEAALDSENVTDLRQKLTTLQLSSTRLNQGGYRT